MLELKRTLSLKYLTTHILSSSSKCAELQFIKQHKLSPKQCCFGHCLIKMLMHTVGLENSSSFGLFPLKMKSCYFSSPTILVNPLIEVQ